VGPLAAGHRIRAVVAPCVLTLGLALACGGGVADRPASPPSDPVEFEDEPEEVGPDVYELVSVTAGDGACYLEMLNPEGVSGTWSGSFDLCPGGPADATPLVGRSVIPAFKSMHVPSPECQGDPACTKSVETTGVATLKAR
jgi:hypothetical protein